MISLWPFALVLACDFIFMAVVRKRVAHVIAAIDVPGQDLAVLSLILQRLERESFLSPKAKQLRAQLDVNGLPASRRIARLERWVATIDSSDHIFVRAIRPVLLWREQLAMGVESWRAEAGPHVGKWLPPSPNLKRSHPWHRLPSNIPPGHFRFSSKTLIPSSEPPPYVTRYSRRTLRAE